VPKAEPAATIRIVEVVSPWEIPRREIGHQL